ncbi:MAG TPA: hypothetical protein VHM30_19445, partial [Gemmatimonadaceae bacterium]|nr:hypothetical protein [Gemmatimonadaceae bacterium]
MPVARRASRAAGTSRPPLAPGAIIPFDYAARFELRGEPGRVAESVITVSPEGVFVAVAIGYGFDEDRARRLSVQRSEESDTASEFEVEIARSGIASGGNGGNGSGRSSSPSAGGGGGGGMATLPAPRIRFAMRASPTVTSGVVNPALIKVADIPRASLIDGFRVNPRFQDEVFTDPQIAPSGVATLEREFRQEYVAEARISDAVGLQVDEDDPGPLLLQRLQRHGDVSFLFSIIDSGTGRELQDQPTHNLASLGKADGGRPFRRLAQPLTFLPRSTVRIQVIERMARRGSLHLVLFGYKLLATSSCPEPVIRAALAAAAKPPRLGQIPSARVIPFDYVVRVPLMGRAGNVVASEIPVDAEGGFVATSIGYGLDVDDRPVLRDLADVRSRATQGQVDLGRLRLDDFAADALCDGIRIDPALLRIAFQPGGALAPVPVELIDRIFQSLNRPEHVSFRYTIADTGTGRDLQN